MLPAAALVLGATLVAAGVPKAAAPRYVASALRRVVTAGPDRALLLAGRLLGCWEILLGSALLLVGSGVAAVAVAACATLTCAAFTVFVALAIRRGAACGCWASLSEGPAGGAELARAAFLTALAIGLLAFRTGVAHPSPGRPSPSWSDLSWPQLSWPVLAWAAALLAGMWLAMLVGGLVLPVRTPRLRRRLGLQLAPGPRGLLAGQLTQLAGFVHAGTNAGRRRYLTARLAETAPRNPARRQARVPLPPRPPGPAGGARHPGRPATRAAAHARPAEGRPR